jgi:hypothetical protein
MGQGIPDDLRDGTEDYFAAPGLRSIFPRIFWIPYGACDGRAGTAYSLPFPYSRSGLFQSELKVRIQRSAWRERTLSGAAG